MKDSLPSLAQRDTVLGETCRMSATSAARGSWEQWLRPWGWGGLPRRIPVQRTRLRCRIRLQRCWSGHHGRDRAGGDAGDHPAEQRMNRTIMQTDPTARHGPIGSFQRVCYLVHLARDGRMAAAPGTRPPALHPDRRRARWEGPNRGRGRPVRCRTIPEGVRGKARSPSNSAASTPPPPSSAQPGRRCAKPSPATASARRPQPRSRPPADHRRHPPAQRPAGHAEPGPGVCGPQPGRRPRPPTVTG